ncbi:MAG: hypothetical protein ABEI58_00330 [Candidatus Nanohaloarchaea archaeon]
MALDAVETIRSTFGSLKTETGLKLLGAFFVLQLLNMAATQYLVPAGGAASVIGGVSALVLAVASIALFIGAMRALDQMELKQEFFTSDLVMPFLRLTGAQIVLSVFALIALYLALIPLMLLGGGLGMLTSLGGGLGSSASPIIMMLGGLVGLVFLLYPVYTLITSLPMVVIDGRRMFEALDSSVLRSKGNKIAMFIASVPVGILYVVTLATALAGAVTGASVSGGQSPGAILLVSVMNSVTGVVFLSLLVEYNKRLPE